MSLETLVTISPSSNKPILSRKGLSDDEVDQLVERSATAATAYRATTLEVRQKIVLKALDFIQGRADELAKEITDQMGRPIAYSAKEISTAVIRARYMLKVSDAALADVPGEEEQNFTRYIRKVPVGPVLIIFAWNYPYLTLINSLIPSLLAGNTVILKPSPQTPTVVEQMALAFLKTGLPENVLQYLHCGSPTQLQRIIRNPAIKLICFTGSLAAGLAVQQAAIGRVDVRVVLELGGKDPAYVRPDVDVAWAAEQIVDGAIFNSGQSCCSVERVYVHRGVHDSFVAAVKHVLKAYRLGDPLDQTTQIGPVVSKRAVATIQDHVRDAIAKGARDETPDNDTFLNPPKTDGNYVAPVLLTAVDHTMTVMTEETFGPVIPVMPVADDEEAVRLMNDSKYGLTASIWTKDMSIGQSLADRVDAGTVFINRCDYPSADLAWTGWKDSGRGHSLSRLGFDQFIKLKSYHAMRHPA